MHTVELPSSPEPRINPSQVITGHVSVFHLHCIEFFPFHNPVILRIPISGTPYYFVNMYQYSYTNYSHSKKGKSKHVAYAQYKL